jgi:hypothetical protein
MSAEDFYNYGPTPENPEPHWYPFTYDGTTGAEINGNIVTLHFVDGARGDADLSADGILTAAGGPVFMIYDGNRDGVPDREQPHVASVQALDGVSWLTLEAPDSSAISNFSMKHLNNENQFEGFQPLYDCVDFTLDSIEVGSTVSVKLIVPDSVQMSRCFVLGKTDENSERTWVDLFSGQANGSEISGNTITYNITDGSAIDTDNSADGSLIISAVPLQAGGPSTGGKLASENVYAYPNPFNPEIARNNIRYSLEESAEVTITIYDLGQKVVRKLLDEAERPAGTELSESWDGRNGRGDLVANGVYYFLIETSTRQRAVGKIALLR